MNDREMLLSAQRMLETYRDEGGETCHLGPLSVLHFIDEHLRSDPDYEQDRAAWESWVAEQPTGAGSVQLTEPRVPAVGEDVGILLDGARRQGECVAVEQDGQLVTVDVHVTDEGVPGTIYRAVLVVPA